MLVTGYPGLPRAWRGDYVHVARFDVPVAVIGDIHGRADLLRKLLVLLQGRPVIVVGDVGDRGPDTRDVLDLLVEHHAIGVVGNHDVWLMTWAAGEGFDPLALSPFMGGRATLESYGATGELVMAGSCPVLDAHRDWLLGLHVAIDLEVQGQRYWVVHGGVPGDFDMAGMGLTEVVPTLARERPSDLMWRANDPETMVPLDRPLIMGHMHVTVPLDLGHVIAIDTGAADPVDGHLTAVLLPERTFVQTP